MPRPGGVLDADALARWKPGAAIRIIFQDKRWQSMRFGTTTAIFLFGIIFDDAEGCVHATVGECGQARGAAATRTYREVGAAAHGQINIRGDDFDKIGAALIVG